MRRREVRPYLVLIAAAALIGGCSNPASKGIKIAVKVVGKAVDEAKVKDLEEKLLGQEHGRQIGSLASEWMSYATCTTNATGSCMPWHSTR